MKNLPLFKVRCSGIGAIMSNPQGKSNKQKYLDKLEELKEENEKYEAMTKKDGKQAQNKWNKILKLQDDLNQLEKNKDDVQLSETCINYLEDWVKEHKYGRRKSIKNQAIDKGIECENEAIFVVNKALGTNYEKTIYNNGEKLENDRCTGREDTKGVDSEGITHSLDTKVCIDFGTFPIFKRDMDSNYKWQGLGYLWLLGEEYKYHLVAKVLVNTPTWMLTSMLYIIYNNIQKKYEHDTLGFADQEFHKEAREVLLNHVFDTQPVVIIDGNEFQITEEECIDREERVQIQRIERDDEAIEKIKQRVIDCRKRLHKEGYKQF